MSKTSFFQKALGEEGEVDINFGDGFSQMKKEGKDHLSDTLRPFAVGAIEDPADISLLPSKFSSKSEVVPKTLKSNFGGLFFTNKETGPSPTNDGMLKVFSKTESMMIANIRQVV